MVDKCLRVFSKFMPKVCVRFFARMMGKNPNCYLK